MALAALVEQHSADTVVNYPLQKPRAKTVPRCCVLTNNGVPTHSSGRHVFDGGSHGPDGGCQADMDGGSKIGVDEHSINDRLQ